MKKIFTLFSLLMCAIVMHAQVNYSFSTASGTYTPIAVGTSPTLVVPDPSYAATDEGYANALPIGFSFNYNGTTYTTFNVNANGFITFGAGFNADPLETNYSNNLTNGPTSQTSVRPIVAPLWDDLDMDANSDIKYELTGAAGSRVLTVQWSNVYWRYTALTPSIAFQVKLYETTNVIEFVYNQLAGATATPTASIGITAAATGSGNFLSVQDATASATASSTTEVASINTRPATGQIYRFTPLSGCSGTPTAGTASAPAAACDNTNFALTLTGYSAAAGVTVQWQRSNVGANSWTNIAGATAPVSQVNQNAPSDYRAIVTCTNSSLTATSNTVTVTQTTTNCPPACTNNIAPANGATNVSYQPNIQLSWAAAPGATSYDVYFGTTTTPPNLGNTAGTAVNITGGLPNTLYYWYVVPRNANGTLGTCSSNRTSFTTGASAAPPVNDECATATSISPYNGVMNGTTISGTASTGIVLCGTDPGTPDEDVWYKFTALQNGDAVITVIGGSTFDAVLQAFSGTCGSLTQMGNCIDTTASGGREQITLTGLVAGQTYYLRVYDYSAGAGDVFTISAAGVALPITLSNFHGTRQGSKNVLGWTTEAEQNNSGFELQRSADGRNFTSLIFVASKAANGNSTQTLSYSFDDVRPLAGTNYYRLKQVDKDGKSITSNVVSIKGDKINTIQLTSVYPNPAVKDLNVIIASPAAEKISLVVTDLVGKVVLQQAQQLVNGDNNLSVNVSSLPSGSYLIKAVCANGCESAASKFVKK